MTDQQAQARELVAQRERARTDKMFLAGVLGYDFQPDVHADLFEQYIKFDRTKTFMFDQSPCRDRLTLWPRGHYKSSSIIVEIVQMILNFPDVRVMIMQGTKAKSKALVKEVRSHFDHSNPRSKLDSLFPEFCSEKIGTVEGFTVPARERKHLKEPTVMVASPKASKAGWHFDAGFFDDLVDEQNYKNPDLVKQTIDDFVHYIPLIDPGGYRYVTGTRYTYGDLYEWIIRNNDGRWQISLRKAWTPKPDGTKTLLFPQRQIADGRHLGFTVEMLEAIQRDNPETFSAQYLNEPISSGRQLFPESFILGAVRPREANAQIGPAILFVDLASSLQADGDKSVVLCGRQINNCPTVCDLRSGHWSTLQIANNVLEQALLHRPIKVLIEGSPGSTYFIDYLRMIAKDKGIQLLIEPIKVSNSKGAKHLRIAAIEGAIKTRRLAFLPNLPNWPALVEQFTQFPKSRHDDEIDTISLMVQFYSGQISNYEVPAVNLPFFLQRPGIDYGLEQQIVVRADDQDSLIPCPEAIF